MIKWMAQGRAALSGEEKNRLFFCAAPDAGREPHRTRCPAKWQPPAKVPVNGIPGSAVHAASAISFFQNFPALINPIFKGSHHFSGNYFFRGSGVFPLRPRVNNRIFARCQTTLSSGGAERVHFRARQVGEIRLFKRQRLRAAKRAIKPLSLQTDNNRYGVTRPTVFRKKAPDFGAAYIGNNFIWRSSFRKELPFNGRPRYVNLRPRRDMSYGESSAAVKRAFSPDGCRRWVRSGVATCSPTREDVRINQ